MRRPRPAALLLPLPSRPAAALPNPSTPSPSPPPAANFPPRAQGEIFAAEGYAKVTGRVGVCIATSGPGATNLVTGLADAMMDSVPLVAITGQVPRKLIGTDGFQVGPGGGRGLGGVCVGGGGDEAAAPPRCAAARAAWGPPRGCLWGSSRPPLRAAG
jgi:hypothetical protein